MTTLFRLAAAALLAASPSLAQEDMARVDLLAGWRDGGRHMAGVRVDLAPGWKTYWRAPGEGGIPPHFDWSGSGNVASIQVHWPVPVVFDQQGLTSVGYRGGVVLPLEIAPEDPDAPIALRLAFDMGLCREVCVPHTARLSADLPVGGAHDEAIGAALARRPLSEEEAGTGPVTCSVLQTADGMEIVAELRLRPQGGAEFAVVELPDKRLWIEEARTERRGDILTASAEVIPPRGQPVAFERDDLRLTVLGERGAVDIHGCD